MAYRNETEAMNELKSFETVLIRDTRARAGNSYNSVDIFTKIWKVACLQFMQAVLERNPKTTLIVLNKYDDFDMAFMELSGFEDNKDEVSYHMVKAVRALTLNMKKDAGNKAAKDAYDGALQIIDKRLSELEKKLK